MKAEVASGNEILVVVVFAALVATAVGYVMSPTEKEVVVIEKPVPVPKKVVRDIGPGWASGNWLGEGDFHFAEKTQHPFTDQPRYAGHPFHAEDLGHAPPGPRLPMP